MKFKFLNIVWVLMGVCVVLTGCAEAIVPEARNVNIPNPVAADKRREAVNERPDSVMYLPLGEDVLVPERISGDDLPNETVGPFELRGETLAGALQLILADYDVSIAFESEQGLTRQVTVANLKGDLDKVVSRVCSLADLYCSYEDGTLVVKDTQTFTVSLPPIGNVDGGQDFINDVITGLSAIIGSNGRLPVSDPTTRTVIYGATQRTSKLAANYFERLRANTAMIVFETYIWEVSLDAGNSTGIDWEAAESFGKFRSSITLNGSVGADFTNPVSIGLPQTVGATPADLVEFLSQFGAVKTISQPQITVLSGASAELRVADTENFVSEVTSTISGDNATTSVSTDSVDSGFTLTIDSSWDKSTVYANVNINLTNVDQIEDFTFSDSGAGGTDTIIQLPQTSERELSTQIRVRPGDSVLIAGLVRETDNFDSSGPGFMQPVLPTSRTAETDNLELVVLLRPRVIVYTAPEQQAYARRGVNQAESLLRSRHVAPVSVTPTVAPAIAVPSVAPTIEPSYVAPVAVVEEPVLAAPVEPTPLFVESPVPKEVPVVPIYNDPPVVQPQPGFPRRVSEYIRDDDVSSYTPSRSSGYTPGYVSGRRPVYEALNARDTVTPTYQAPPQASVSVNNVPPSVYPSYEGESSVKSPLSANIYNQAQPLNVYDIYEQSQGNQ